MKAITFRPFTLNKISYILLVMLVLFACKKIQSNGGEPFVFENPIGFPEPVYTFTNNPLSYNRFGLGRDLFYSKELSSDGSISCGSCHDQAHAFADHNAAFSAGVNGTLGTRSSPVIFNLAWQPHFMWDGGVNHLEIFSFAPITNPLEMNETMENVIQKLNDSEQWKSKFKKAYGIDVITDQAMFRAIAQYLAMIVSDDTKYDKVRRGETTFTVTEQAGYELFQSKCASCHQEPLLTDYTFRNNGLTNVFSDLGRETITQDPNDRGKFKVPTLRNVEITYPYMHDGSLYSLEDVLDHYSEGVVNSATLDPQLTGGIPLTQDEKSSIIQFLKTLTDYTMMGNTLYSEQ